MPGKPDETHASSLTLCYSFRQFTILRKVNMTSSTKPEVHSVSHCRQGRTEPLPQVTSTENLMKFGRVVFEICEQTDKQTHRQTHRHAGHNISHPYRERSNYSLKDEVTLCSTGEDHAMCQKYSECNSTWSSNKHDNWFYNTGDANVEQNAQTAILAAAAINCKIMDRWEAWLHS